MRRASRSVQQLYRHVVWAWWFLLGCACTYNNELKPAYRLSGKVVTAGTDWSVGNPVKLGICYRNEIEPCSPLLTWTTDSAGNFDHLFQLNDDSDRLRMVVLSNPARHFEPITMPSLVSRTMTDLRVELPALGWLRWRMNLESMGQGGLAMIQAGSWSETLYQSVLSERIIPWNSVVPLQVQVTYRPKIGAGAVVSTHTLMVPPLDTLVWTWAP